MSEIAISKDHCTYRIIRAETTDELEKMVNEIIARGWNEDGLISGGWEFVGGICHDEKGYYQAMMNCPMKHAEAYIQKV